MIHILHTLYYATLRRAGRPAFEQLSQPASLSFGAGLLSMH